MALKPVIASSAAAAFAGMKKAHARGEPFRVVLLDCLMPETDGFGLAEQIRQDPDLASDEVDHALVGGPGQRRRRDAGKWDWRAT